MRVRQLRLIARREFKERTKSRTFRITMVLMVLLVIASVVLPVVASRVQSEPQLKIGVLEPSDSAIIPAINSIQSGLGAQLRVQSMPDRARAEAALKARELDMLVVEGDAVYLAVEPVSGAPNIQADRANAIASTVHQVEVLREAGVDSAEVIDTINAPNLPVKGLTPAPPRNSEDAASAYPALILLFVFLTLGGAFILNGVIEEKSSRVVEILLATIKPSELLVGKVIGIAAVGLLQGAVLVGATFASHKATPGAPDAGALSLPVVVYAIIWFMLGFALYAGMYACAGALVSRSEDAQNLVFPLQIPILLSFFVGAAASIGGPNPVVTEMSFIPFTAPMTMLERMAAAEVQWWEVAISMASVAVTAALVLRLATVIFAGGILRSGQRVKLRDAWRNPAG